MRRNRLRLAFSLMELAILLGIIVSVLTLLAPSFRLAREVAHQTVCAANLQTLARAAHLYADDFGDRFPDAGGAFGQGVYYNYWPSYLRHYLPGVSGTLAEQSLQDRQRNPAGMPFEIRNLGWTGKQGYRRTRSIGDNPFFCPATTGPMNTTNHWGPCGESGVWTDYAMSAPAVGAPRLWEGWPKRRRSEIRYPGRTLLLADAYMTPLIANASYYSISARHLKGTRANAVLLDGHVESCLWHYSFADEPDQDITFQQPAGPGTGFKLHVLP